MKRTFTSIALSLALAFGAALAFAAAPYLDLEQRLTREQLHETGLDTLTPEQLARLNALLRDEATTAAEAEAAAAATAPTPVADATRTGPDPGRSYLGLDTAPIHDRLQGTVDGWEPGTVFVLENGQQWKVLKGSMKLRKPLQSPAVVLVPGLAGRWFLQVDEDLPKARVYRID